MYLQDKKDFFFGSFLRYEIWNQTDKKITKQVIRSACILLNLYIAVFTWRSKIKRKKYGDQYSLNSTKMYAALISIDDTN